VVARNRSVRLLVSVWMAISAAACAPPPGDPAATVLRAFDAYRRGDAAAVQASLDFEGRGTAASWCKGGLALECLRGNYFGRGDLVSREAKVVAPGHRDPDSDEQLAGVRLTSIWSPPLAAGQRTLCQWFTLSYAGSAEWRIRTFDQPRSCP
jgi:hypothetical protein